MRSEESLGAECRSETFEQPPAGLLRLLLTPHRLWSHISVDFCRLDYPCSAGNTTILTIVDCFSKMVHLSLCPSYPQLKTHALLQHEFCLHGISVDIVSDRGTQFTAKFLAEFCCLLDISVSVSSGFHSQSNDQMERLYQELETDLRLPCSQDLFTGNTT